MPVEEIHQRPNDTKRARLALRNEGLVSGLMLDLSPARFAQQTGGRTKQQQPVAFRVALEKLTPLARRLALGLRAATPRWPDHELLLRDADGGIVQLQWDLLGDVETPEACLLRHAGEIAPFEIVSLPLEPSHM